MAKKTTENLFDRIDRDSDEYKEKLSQARAKIEERISEVLDSIENNQSSLATHANLNGSSASNGSHRGADNSGAKVQQKNKKQEFLERIAAFIDGFYSRNDISVENFIEKFTTECGL